ncbi:hypothetical protein JAAARDRAFT_42446 [Jaapia argillacea MUCL 33604]|uniref:Methyltransferase domain-containing protein n=1 Tax=Jaapia argillacea MUCL 33604 TaxID=933084 RepID=A0A067P4Z8_9AGAM|nr:hypothetical protein JAAARDRAFT_42446 [Jaapia argillacea MUCL 33604]
MASLVLSRHPRYALLIFLVLMGTLYMLASDKIPEYEGYGVNESKKPLGYDPDLGVRVQRAERVYQKMLKNREALVDKFGPNPNDVVNFPPDREPWPAYTVWDFFPPSFNCPHEVERIGAMGDGGKWICGLSRLTDKPDCIIYSIGVNYESSFEAEVLERTKHCQIWGYDFTTESFGPQIPRLLRSRAHFKPWGLGTKDAHGSGDVQKMYTLESLMKMNGHTHIDILKVDMESGEFDTLTAIVKPYLTSELPLPFGQLQLEIHLWGKSFAEFKQWWEMLEEAGLRPFFTEPNMVYQNYNRDGSPELSEYTYLNIKGNNIFISDGSSSDYVRHS